MSEIKIIIDNTDRWISREKHDLFTQRGKTLCQRVKSVDYHCSNEDYYGLEEYKICQECQSEKDITIRQGNVIFQLWTTEESRWFNKSRYNLVKSYFPNKICKRTRYTDEEVEYCSNVVSPNGEDICFPCLTGNCEGLNCDNKVDIITVDYQLCKDCYTKDNLGICKGDANPYLWSNTYDRWVDSKTLEFVKLFFKDICGVSKEIDSEVKFCPNVMKNPHEGKCHICISENKEKICQGFNCSNESVFSNYDYNICRECSLKKDLVINKNGYTCSIWVNDESRWSCNMEYWHNLGATNYCKNVKYINGVKNYCSNIKPPNKDKCYACEEITPKSARWITFKDYFGETTKNSLVCAYSPTDGPNKGKICGNVYVKAHTNPLKNRCTECEGKP